MTEKEHNEKHMLFKLSLDKQELEDWTSSLQTLQTSGFHLNFCPKCSVIILCIFYIYLLIKTKKNKKMLGIILFSKWEKVISLYQSVTWNETFNYQG